MRGTRLSNTHTHWGGADAFQMPSEAGLILVDRSQKPVYYNAEAIRVLTYPDQLKKLDGSPDLLSKEIRRLLRRSLSCDEPCQAELMSGRRHYSCRVFVLSKGSDRAGRTIIGLLLERSTPKPAQMSQAAAKFHLTGREQETVGLLTLGLTSKEIANRMNVSPNTVRAFCRLVMAKMAVSTRSGIVGKIAQM